MNKLFIGIFFSALLVLAVGIYFLSSVFISPYSDERYLDEFPTAGTTTPVSVIDRDLPPQLFITKSGETYSATALIVSSSTEKLDDGLYTLTDDPSTYDIFYNEPTGILFISIYKEPLGFSRALAERTLLETLPLSKEEICKIQTKVTTNIHVNSFYSGVNLGLSFCPGSVSLE